MIYELTQLSTSKRLGARGGVDRKEPMVMALFEGMKTRPGQRSTRSPSFLVLSLRIRHSCPLVLHAPCLFDQRGPNVRDPGQDPRRKHPVSSVAGCVHCAPCPNYVHSRPDNPLRNLVSFKFPLDAFLSNAISYTQRTKPLAREERVAVSPCSPFHVVGLCAAMEHTPPIVQVHQPSRLPGQGSLV